MVPLLLTTVFGGVVHESSPYGAYAKEILSIKGDGIAKDSQFTVAEIEKMVEGSMKAKYTMMTLVEPHTDQYEGISLPYLLKQVGIKDTAKSVQVVCSDGVSMKFTIAEIMKQDYMNEVDNTKLTTILAYGKNDIPLVKDKTSEGYDKTVGNEGGPLRLMVGQTEKGERNSPKCLQNVVSIVVSAKEQGLQFNDLGNFYAWTEEAIYSLVDRGVLTGVGNGKFAPEQQVTRAQFAKMLVLSKKLTPATSPTGMFADVPKSAWYTPYVESAAKAGLIQGVGENRFNPDATINRNEIAVLAAKAMGKDANQTATDDKPTYRDKDKIPSWAMGSVIACQEKDLFNNIAVGYFNGTGKINRAEAAVIIYRMEN